MKLRNVKKVISSNAHLKLDLFPDVTPANNEIKLPYEEVHLLVVGVDSQMALQSVPRSITQAADRHVAEC